MTPSNEKSAGGGAVLETVACKAGGGLYHHEDGVPFSLLPPAGEVEQLVRRTDAESALKLQADRIAELEGVLRALRRSHDADRHGHGLTVAQLLTIDDALAKTA